LFFVSSGLHELQQGPFYVRGFALLLSSRARGGLYPARDHGQTKREEEARTLGSAFRSRYESRYGSRSGSENTPLAILDMSQ